MAVNKTKKSFVKMKKIKAHLSECRKTQKLDLSSLELTEIPEDFMNLVKAAGVTTISELDMHSNLLSELPNELAEFRTLRSLRMGKNKFQGLPVVVLRFAKLQVLDFSENDMREMELGIRYLVSLRELNFSKNQLMTLPTFWGHLNLLVYLNLAKNRMMELPESLGLLRSLQRLDVSENLLTSLPKTLQDLQELITLDVHGNHLTEVPPSLGLLRNLMEFECSGNPLSDPTSSFYLQGFERFMDYLRNLHELQLLEDLICQKPESVSVGSYKKYRTRSEVGQRPLLRTGHSITQAGPITYIFGGRVSNYVKVEETFAIDSRTLLWAKLSTSGSIPTARDGHAAAFDGNKRLYIFGGRNEENKLLNDIYYLDLKTMTWFQPPVEGSIPYIREGASMVVIGNQLIVFGGRGSRQRYNDVHVLDTQVWTWTLQNTKGSIPAPRQNAAATVIRNKFYVHGGKGSLMLDDLHALDMVAFTWSRVSQKGLGPSPRCKHMCWIYQSRLYVAGGVDANGEPLSSLYVLPLGNEIKNDVKLSTNLMSSGFHERTSGIQYRNNVWIELESEIAPCITNVYCHCDEKIVVLQEGKETVEASPTYNEDSSNIEGFSWDYYLEASCDMLRQKAHDIQTERPMDSKSARIQFTKQNQMLQLPKSFRVMSEKEHHLLEHVKNYQKRFMQLYPHRRPFMFMAYNECNVQKCICTTIRPSHSDYIEFFSWELCASYLANFLAYEPLENPVMFPLYLPSPSSILKWRRADCFDFSVVLVSFLTGAGYEAFCVVGYAPLKITTNNQETDTCPNFLNKKTDLQKDKALPARKIPKEAKNEYIRECPPILNTKYLGNQKEERDTQVLECIKIFRDICDHELLYDQNEEQDNLINYMKEKASSHTLWPESEEKNEVPLINNAAVREENSEIRNNDSSTELREEDVLNKKRLHCWVMVTSNKRDVPESFFIEPSTGHRYTLHGSPYQAVEYLWNQHNIFINMQPNLDKSGLNDMYWDLRDVTKWERVLDTFLSAGDVHYELMQTSGSKITFIGKKTNKSPANVTLESPSTLETDKSKKTGAPELHPSISKPENQVNDGNQPNTNMESLATGIKSTLKIGGKATSAGPLKEVVDKGPIDDGIHHGFKEPYHWLLPSSWVPRLEIPIEIYMTRCPGGVKRTHYNRCTHEIYSFYGDFVRWDGLVERMILYEDDERSSILEIHDYFLRRKDGLHKRIFNPALNKVHDFFGHGASFGLKEMEIVDGQSRKFLFYHDARNDGLLRRDEIIGTKIVENYANHEAHLIYRCACYGPLLPPPRDEYSPRSGSERHLESVAGTNADASIRGSISRPGSVRLDGSNRPISHGRVSVDSQRPRPRSRMMSHWQASSSNRNKVSTPASEKQVTEKKLAMAVPKRRPISEKLLPILKITQKYEKRTGASSKDNVAKHVFKLTINQIKVVYHRVDRHLTMNSHVYNKDGSLTLIQVDPFSPEPTTFDKLDEFHNLILAEREAIKSVRDTEREIEEILQQRLKEEQNVVLDTPYIDIACMKQDDLFQEGEDAIKLPTDYLSAFLPPGVRPRQKLTRQQMLEVRDSCLGALKDRLVNRATIIQTRYDEETSALAKRRANFERDREQMTVEDEETYNEDCENAVFRIRILELRAKQHEEEALKKYIELEHKLQNDPRLARLYRGGST